MTQSQPHLYVNVDTDDRRHVADTACGTPPPSPLSDSSYDVSSRSQSPQFSFSTDCGDCPRTLPLQYWERTQECLEAKWRHTELIDETYTSREDRILQTTLRDLDIVLEPNPFPYDCPKGVHHFTLWCRWDMDELEIEEHVQDWIKNFAPNARRWNYDENESRSIDLFHVHVYIEGDLEVSVPIMTLAHHPRPFCEDDEQSRKRQRVEGCFEDR